MRKLFIWLVLSSLAPAFSALADDTGTPAKIGLADADKYYDKTMIVTGTVAQVSARQRIVFLNMGKPFPDNPFTAVVFNDSTNKFTNLLSLKGKDVEITGRIVKYNGKPEIVLSNADQLTVKGPSSARSGDVANQFLGEWAVTIPGDHTGWLGVQSADGKLTAQMLWGWGSVYKLDGAEMNDGKLVLTHIRDADSKGADGKPMKTKVAETIIVTRDGDQLKFSDTTPKADGSAAEHTEYTGKRLPPMPPAPDLSQVKFGEPVTLFNGRDLTGWKLVETDGYNGWRAKDGVLANVVDEPEGQPHKNYGNLRTVADFEDFSLHAETRLSKGGNSGIYIRGIDEVQIFDSYGKPLDSHNMGAIYSRIKPTASAEKPAGEWQTVDITYVKRHATVVLNGVKIIDNQPVLGPTGGALWPEVDRPGPIMLQGDHTGIEYRNLVLRPVVN